MEGRTLGIAESATAAGIVLYGLLVALLIAFWRRMRGKSMEDLLAESADEHHHVHRVLAKHPGGGDWPNHKRWMNEKA
jgi:hypothetical protein